MRLFDFLKSKKTETKPIIDVQLKDLERTIKEKKKELSIKEEEILNQVKNKTKLLIKDLEEKSIKLENIDLNQKKTEERVKLIVKENLFYFLSNLKKLINNINNMETEILELTKENELFEKSIDKIKKSDSYKNEIDNEILIHEKNQQYEKELLKLRELVNFKALTNVFHSNEKIMNKINNYKNYFKDAFESDSQTIVHLLKEAKIEDNIISKKI